MTATIATLRADFPEFTDPTAYPDSSITTWLTVAGLRLDPLRWGDLLDIGTELFVAHNLVLGRTATRTASVGGAPGSNQGPLTSKSIDKVSASYDSGSVTVEGAGNWNATTYGTRYWELAMMVGSGGMQVC